ncbi:MAG TPA: hypothetical protein VH352_16300 [Pseudonocardiaceae bacterium]|nr:hypothetical protein [Pseudonocardiaceae bacterium]
MIKDPLTVWQGPFPYDVLAPAGVTPRMPHARMQDVSFDLLAKGMPPQSHKAWDELRTVRRRLLVDLVLYPVDPANEIADARARVERELAEPGEPPEVAEALEFRAPPPEDWAAELGPLDLPEPQEVPSYAEFDSVTPPALVDRLIEFDR